MIILVEDNEVRPSLKVRGRLLRRLGAYRPKSFGGLDDHLTQKHLEEMHREIQELRDVIAQLVKDTYK